MNNLLPGTTRCLAKGFFIAISPFLSLVLFPESQKSTQLAPCLFIERWGFPCYDLKAERRCSAYVLPRYRHFFACVPCGERILYA